MSNKEKFDIWFNLLSKDEQEELLMHIFAHKVVSMEGLFTGPSGEKINEGYFTSPSGKPVLKGLFTAPTGSTGVQFCPTCNRKI
ncbi:hypothetical protein QWJ20_10710 [Pectobacterium sp. S5]|uniref:hypothetical protein n=1 Tax=Pectobacterium TaxID=122277 RepID=UPI003D9B564E